MDKKDFKILVVDDEPGMREGIGKALGLEGFSIESAGNGTEAIHSMKRNDIDLAFVDLKLPDIDGCEVARRTCGNGDKNTVLVIMTAYATVETAVNAMKIGVADYIKKPFDNNDLISIANRYYKQKRISHPEGSSSSSIVNDALFVDQKMRGLTEVVGKIKDCEIPVLIIGESGTGKEVFARLIHSMSCRRNKPFIGVNCSAVPSQLMESEFFGHEKGAFSDAVSSKPGKFELAEDGILFLDEIGDMEFKLQSKLLRVLEEKSFERIGGISSLPFRARLVASTNRNLSRLIDQNQFRSDLYFRLKGIELHLPPLRERRNEIEYFVRYFLKIFCEYYGKEDIRIASEALGFLKKYDWPGNIRELKNVVESAVVLSEDHNILLSKDFRIDREMPYQEPLSDKEKEYILEALEHNRYNRTLAARELNISRKTLYNKMKKYLIN